MRDQFPELQKSARAAESAAKTAKEASTRETPWLVCGSSIIHDREGDTIGAVISFRDVSTARASSLEMARVAQHDVLTQLPNRTLFDDRLTQAISLAERQNKKLAVLFVDVDQFKRINDTLGHRVGDDLLRSVAARLTACIRRTDTVSRLGGDEFLILLSQVEHAEDAAVTARKILRAIASPHIIDNKSLDINVSIGGSTYPTDGQDAESLVSQADVAMIEPRSDAFIADYLTVEEQALLADATAAERLCLVTLLWSAKESALKAVRLGLRADTRWVNVRPVYKSLIPNSWSPLQICLTGGGDSGEELFHGWWQTSGSIVRTIVADLVIDPPISGYGISS
jgi:diguanylate cyclase (GGDEF)-like protein